MTYQSTINIMKLVVAAALASLLVAPASAATKTEQTFGQWKVTCVQNAPTAKQCAMMQTRVSGDKNKRPVFAWIVAPNASKQLMNQLNVAFPPGVSIKEGVRVSIGSKAPMTVPFEICAPRGCVATFGMDAATLQAMSSSPSASSNYVLANRKLMQIQVDLKDFAKAYEYFKTQLTAQ